MSYQLFIKAPNDRLVNTSNVRFWKDSGIAVDLTSAGMRGNGIVDDIVWRRREFYAGRT